jgi:hypothetical protein
VNPRLERRVASFVRIFVDFFPGTNALRTVL